MRHESLPMSPKRLVKLFGLMRETLDDGRWDYVAETESGERPPAPVDVAKSKSVHRLLHRVGHLRSKRAGKRSARDIESAIWAVAEATDESVGDVGKVLTAFAGDEGRGVEGGICADQPKCDQCRLTKDCRRFVKKKPTIKDLPESERPRERLLLLGDEAVSDTEILAILIGKGSENRSALDLAKTLLAHNESLTERAGLTAAELRQIPGIGPAKAAQLLAAFAFAKRYATTRLELGAVFNCSREIYLHYKEALRHERREVFTCVLVDIKHQYLGQERISIGTLRTSPATPREVFRPAIRAAAHGVIFVHNHPSGDPAPSAEDLNITRRLADVGKTIGIRVLDHVIIGNHDYYSFADKGLL